MKVVVWILALLVPTVVFMGLSYQTYSQRLAAPPAASEPKIIDVEDTINVAQFQIDTSQLQPNSSLSFDTDWIDGNLVTAEVSEQSTLSDSTDSQLNTEESLRSELQVSEEVSEPLDLKLDLSALPSELADKVSSALREPEQNKTANLSLVQDLEEYSESYRGRLPAMNFQSHIYSTDIKKRWVKVNGKEVSEGQWITQQVLLQRIEPQYVLVRYQDKLIKIPALHEWAG